MSSINPHAEIASVARMSLEDFTVWRRDFENKHPSPTRPTASAFVKLQERHVMLKMPGGFADAYFVHPHDGAHPGIIVWPDALSVRAAFQCIAKRLAGSGYAVLIINPYYRTQPVPIGVDATDFYEPAGRETVMRLVETITPEMTLADAAALIRYLDQQSSVATHRKLGVIGYCLGGGMAFATAGLAPERIGALASFHGSNLVTPEATSPHRRVGAMRASALIAIAEDDDAKSPDAKNQLRDAFDAAGLDAEVEVYRDAMHGWCPSDTRAYNKVQAERAWLRMLAVFKSGLK